MSLRTRLLAGILSWYESTTDETVLTSAPVLFADDMIFGNAAISSRWVGRSTGGAGGAAKVADGANGVLSLPLSATNEIQLNGVDHGDDRNFRLNQKLVFEARVSLSVLPTGAVVAVVGLCGDHNAAVNTVAESIWFRWDGSGAITVETDDTVHETSQVATGVTLTAGQWVTLRIECDTPGAIRFYIDGVRVAATTTFNMSQVPALALQPVMRIGKEAASTAVGTLQVDYVRAWQARTA